MNQSFMKEKAVFPLLLSMSAPMILSMLINSLYNVIDSIFVTKYSTDAMTALSLVYPLQNLIISISVGFGIAINVRIALDLGKGDPRSANRAATQGMLFSILHGILLNIAAIAVMPAFLRMYTSDENIIGSGITYANIVFCFSTVNMIAITYEKIYQALGKMVLTMISLIAGSITNIILDPIMIFGLGPVPEMGIRGAAWATGIGQTVTLLVYLAMYLLRPIPVRLEKKYLKPDKNLLLHLYSIGIPATLNLALPSLMISALNAILSAFSGLYVMVLGIYYKLQTLLYLPASGIVQGMRPLISYNYGAKEQKRVRQIYHAAFIMTILFMVLGTLLCLTIPDTLIGLFTDDVTAVREGVTALGIICIGFPVSALSVVSAGALEALGKGVQSLCISLLRYVLVLLPAAWILSRSNGAVGVWQAFPLAEFFTAIVAYGIYVHVMKKVMRYS